MKNIIKFIIKWLGTTKLLSIPRAYMERGLAYYYSSKGRLIYDFIGFQNSRNTKGIDLIQQIRRETEMLLSDQEAYLIYATVKKTEKIKGDIAEVGVYKGGSAKLIREATKKTMHLFDTFEGLPDLCAKDDPKKFQKGKCSASFENVKSYLSNYPNVHFYKGLFPATAESVKDKKFSFVHFDVDIYESTLNCLKFFYPQMSRGGVIISHDYPSSGGVRKAFNEFFQDKPEIVIEPYATSQCLVVKV